tara:strand:- start:3327 stop:3920 length:594 start_codon:yes stop_codon:yes gene_type:complete
MSTAFIICNGPSRKEINLESLRQYGKIIGCNALYRDFMPDVLVAVDTRMVRELNESLIQFKTECWTQASKKYKKLKGFTFITKPQPYVRWCSGSTALLVTNKFHGPFDKVYILGMDLNANPSNSNLYLGTRNYKDVTKEQEHFSTSIDKWGACFRDWKNTEHIRVVGNNPIKVEKWNTYKNFSEITIDQFREQFNGS